MDDPIAYTLHGQSPWAHHAIWSGFVAGASSALGSAFSAARSPAPLYSQRFGSLQADGEVLAADGQRVFIEIKHFHP
jgi:hypothetical protein